MTTEVVIINRMGVALATDSAVTITGPGGTKVFDTGDKLFELDCNSPVGIMINGNMHFLGVPWELVIKDFREAGGGGDRSGGGNESRPEAGHGFKSMRGALQEFLDSIIGENREDGLGEGQYVRDRATEEFEAIEEAILKVLTAGSTPSRKLTVAIQEEATKRLELLDQSKGWFADSLSPQAILKSHGERINKALGVWSTRAFPSVRLPKALTKLLVKVVVSALRSKLTSEAATGLVVAGYGEGDTFPSVALVEIDGAVCGQLRYFHGREYKVDQHANHGDVIPLAQNDVAERLLSGADARFIKKTKAWMIRTLENAREELVPVLQRSGVERSEANALLQGIGDNIVSGYEARFVPGAQKDFRNDFTSMAALMPKQDMVELAEALVNITAIERKATPGQSTVGGPVDVALITKHEGFVWIKRKYFFEAKYNPKYYSRRFGISSELGERQ